MRNHICRNCQFYHQQSSHTNLQDLSEYYDTEIEHDDQQKDKNDLKLLNQKYYLDNNYYNFNNCAFDQNIVSQLQLKSKIESENFAVSNMQQNQQLVLQIKKLSAKVQGIQRKVQAIQIHTQRIQKIYKNVQVITHQQIPQMKQSIEKIKQATGSNTIKMQELQKRIDYLQEKQILKSKQNIHKNNIQILNSPQLQKIKNRKISWEYNFFQQNELYFSSKRFKRSQRNYHMQNKLSTKFQTSKQYIAQIKKTIYNVELQHFLQIFYIIKLSEKVKFQIFSSLIQFKPLLSQNFKNFQIVAGYVFTFLKIKKIQYDTKQTYKLKLNLDKYEQALFNIDKKLKYQLSSNSKHQLMKILNEILQQIDKKFIIQKFPKVYEYLVCLFILVKDQKLNLYEDTDTKYYLYVIIYCVLSQQQLNNEAKFLIQLSGLEQLKIIAMSYQIKELLKKYKKRQ